MTLNLSASWLMGVIEVTGYKTTPPPQIDMVLGLAGQWENDQDKGLLLSKGATPLDDAFQKGDLKKCRKGQPM